MGYPERIKKLESLLDQLSKIYVDFPTDERTEKHFDQWTIREVLIHLNGWNELRAVEIENLLDGEEVPFIEDYDEYNRDIIEESEGMKWEGLLKDFDELKKDLIRGFKAIPADMHAVPIWEGELYTPDWWLDEDIRHHTNHINEIKDVLQKIG